MAGSEQGGPTGLLGCWHMQEYALSTGVRYPLDGLMIVTPSHFSAVHFMVGEQGPQRGAGEGGRYRADGRTLTFRHRYFMSMGAEIAGVPSAGEAMVLERPGDEPHEECTYEIQGETLRIFFPSDNVITLKRLPDG